MNSVNRVVTIMCCATACAAAQSGPPSEVEALAIVQAFIRAELNGDYRSDAVRVYGCEGDFQPTTDTMEPVADARILDNNAVGDSVAVRVEYRVLGDAHVGDRRSSFTERIRADTTVFRIVKDTVGNPRVYCGPRSSSLVTSSAFARSTSRAPGG